MTMSGRLVSAGLVLAAALLPSMSVHANENDDRIVEQRELFMRVYPQAELGDWGKVEALSVAERKLLSEYVLWPDLRAAFFRARLRTADHGDIESFLDEHGTLKPARELRYRYAIHLAGKGDDTAYLHLYESFYQGLELAKLDCLALAAEIGNGETTRIANRALALWLVGKSQVNECDPVFAFLKKNQLIQANHYRERYLLAIDAREFALARWLAKSIDAAHVEAATRWQKAQSDPEGFIRRYGTRTTEHETLEQLTYAVERLTYRDPVLALDHWQELNRRQPFSEEQRQRTLRHIALWTARDKLPGAYALLTSLKRAAQNDEVMRWRARTSLRESRWTDLILDIADMSDEERESEQWQYWRGIALLETGNDAAARLVLGPLAGERSYYGFLAADQLGTGYALQQASLEAEAAALETMSRQPELVRARELFLVGLDGRGRSEWDAIVTYFTPEQKLTAAILANQWGWHSRAISAAASVGEYDDLALRYPLPYLNTFTQHSEAASIPTTWAYGIARSESLFMRDARSSAGAIGLMQLMPATGRQVAREIKLPYSGLATLTNPQSNIRLGTSYLGKMADRYGGNRVLATAAYNAGPHRVDRWLPEQGAIDARVWIENIPFNETRKYVRRVMAAKTIFHWRMTGNVRRLSSELPRVVAATAPRMAQR